MTDLLIMPDWRSCLYQWLIAQDELTDLVDGRVYSELPKSKEFPLVRLSQIADPTITAGVHWAVRAVFQVDVWGTSQNLTWEIAATIKSLIESRLAGAHDTAAGSFIAGNAKAGGTRRSTEPVERVGTESDVETSAARPHCSFDFTVILHPSRIESGS